MLKRNLGKIGLIIGLSFSFNSFILTVHAKALTTTQQRHRAADKTDGVGKVLATRPGNAHQPFVLANTNVKLYDSLKHVNNRYYISVTGDKEELYPPTNKVVIAKYYDTEKGTYCAIQTLHHIWVTRPFRRYTSQTWSNLRPNPDWGYVALKDLKATSYYRSKIRIHRTPCYIVSFNAWNPSNLAMNLGNTEYHAWSNAPGTAFRTFAHDTDTLINRQLYATQRLTRTDGRRYLFVQDATGHPVGWVPETHQLVRGIYHDVGQRLLKPIATERMTRVRQTTIPDANTSPQSPSQIYRVYGIHDFTLHRLLILTAENTPIEIIFARHQPQKLIYYNTHYRLTKRFDLTHIAADKSKTFRHRNDDDLEALVTIYRPSRWWAPFWQNWPIIHFVDGDDLYEEEGYSAKGTLYRYGNIKLTSGVWSNQSD